MSSLLSANNISDWKGFTMSSAFPRPDMSESTTSASWLNAHRVTSTDILSLDDSVNITVSAAWSVSTVDGTLVTAIQHDNGSDILSVTSHVLTTEVTSMISCMNASDVTSVVDDQLTSPIPWMVRFLVTLIVSVLIVSTNIVNIIVIRRTRSIPSNAKVYLTSLSVADLTTGLVTCSPAIVAAYLDFWPYGSVWCQVSGVTHGTSAAVSIWSLSFVSVDRYIALLKPLHYASILTTRRRNLVLASQWLMAVIMFSAPILTKTDLRYYQFSPTEGICGLYWEYPMFCVATGVVIPVMSGSIIVVTTVRILRHLKRAERAVRSTRRANKDGKATAILVATASMYFLCWGPYSVGVILQSISSSMALPPQVQFAVLWLANCNSFINVLIYSAIYKSFRQQVKHIFLTLVTCGRGCRKSGDRKQEELSGVATMSSTSSITARTTASSASLRSAEALPYVTTSGRL